jgi:hypothetical protein
VAARTVVAREPSLPRFDHSGSASRQEPDADRRFEAAGRASKTDVALAWLAASRNRPYVRAHRVRAGGAAAKAVSPLRSPLKTE